MLTGEEFLPVVSLQLGHSFLLGLILSFHSEFDSEFDSEFELSDGLPSDISFPLPPTRIPIVILRLPPCMKNPLKV